MRDAATPLSMWLPGEAARAVVDEREGVREAERVYGDFALRLRAIDPRFRLYLHGQDTPEELEEAELRQGFYYLLRANEDGTFAAFEVRNPDGSYREPDDAVLEAVRRMDPDRVRNVKHERATQRRKAEAEREHRKRFASEERQARLLELADHKWRLQVPINDAMAALGKKEKD